ncbi:hypothetical protein Clacol_002221 [Clathrus columnatus]|uniref:Aminotransferase class V domain-containing protein n=1 Tax=Clathrus columnatus TaxID=1419009 RepID=A0AAV5A433_9AGAM|nr:hypothetical protein Clacol_002221 [Clathrus columnatus]
MVTTFFNRLLCGHSSFKLNRPSSNGCSVSKASERRDSKETICNHNHIQHTEKTHNGFVSAQQSFDGKYPAYHSSLLDELRDHEYTRLGNIVYLDYTGATLYPECLVREAGQILLSEVLGNPHSTNLASRSASNCTADARSAVLKFFNADPEVYCVVWTANATAGAKIIGESFPWKTESTLFLPIDNHNSMNGIRRFAQVKEAEVEYYSADNIEHSHNMLSFRLPKPGETGLFCLTGQSNVSGFKADLSLINEAASRGFYTLLDAAALAPTTSISLSGQKLNNSVDAMTISLYKIMGYPTGLGALVIKKKFLQLLQKPWFAGGTVEIVQVPGDAYTLEEGVARFEDGTINFLSLNIVPRGLSLVAGLIPHVKPRILSLTHWTMHALDEITHPSNNRPLVYIRSPPLDTPFDELLAHYGGVIAFEVADDNGDFISCDAIEYAAGKANICVRSGCMCNPGGTSSIQGLGFIVCALENGYTKRRLEDEFGPRSRGVVVCLNR